MKPASDYLASPAATSSPNPLRSRDFLIPFDAIKAEHVAPGIREALAEAEASLAEVAAAEAVSYETSLGALDALTERLGRVVSVAQHLTSVMNTAELRAAYNEVLPEFSSFFARLPLHEGLWRVLSRFAETEEARALTGVEKRHLDKTLRDFRRAGADLPLAAKARAEALSVELSQLQTKFAENVLDSANAFELVISDEADLAGLPPSAVAQARASAAAKNKQGWRFTLQAPSLLPFLQYAKRRDLRERMYRAFTHRAAGADFDGGAFDNRPLLERILALRREQAELLGFKDFADYRLEVTMVGSGAAAQRFVGDLSERTTPYWRDETEALLRHAAALGLDELQPWDVAFVTEGLRQARFDFDEEALRPYFPLERVMAGMFETVRRLFGVEVKERQGAPVWHPEVRVYDLYDEDGVHLGSFYADWFPREEKQSGAWMNELITGGPREDGFAPHLGLMVGNFTPPADGKPALLTHDEVQTTFHEFGHLLHHCLSRVSVPARSGINVAWDFVELPSQLMENWTWEKEALDLFARHFETDEPIPEDLFSKMHAAKTFMAASRSMRQLSFGTVDLGLHIDYRPKAHEPKGGTGEEAVSYAREVMRRFAVKPHFADNDFVAAFTHVFAGGYAAAYYSYKWAEVLDADVFTRFQQEGIFNPETGRDFLHKILSRGDAADAAELFRDFMGRDPDPEALLARDFGAVQAREAAPRETGGL